MEDITTTTEDTRNIGNTITAIAILGFAAYGLGSVIMKANGVVKGRVAKRAIKKYEMEIAKRTLEVG